MRILVAGELNADAVFVGLTSFPRLGHEVLADHFSLELGSSSAICAAGLARLGNEVAFVTKVGTDLMGRFCLDQLQRLGIDASPAIVDPEWKTGITVSMSTSDPALLTYPGTISELSAADACVAGRTSAQTTRQRASCEMNRMTSPLLVRGSTAERPTPCIIYFFVSQRSKARRRPQSPPLNESLGLELYFLPTTISGPSPLDCK